MAKIETYPLATPAATDLLLGTDANDTNATKNFTVQSIWDGQSNLVIEDEGIVILNDTTTLNFIGASVTATSPGAGQVDITMAAGLAAGLTAQVQFNTGGALDASSNLTFFTGTNTLTSVNITSTVLCTVNELRDSVASLRGGILQNHIAPLGQIGQLILNTDLGTHGGLLLNGAQPSDTPAPVTGGIYASEIHINKINGNTAGGGGSYLPTYAFGARLQNDSLYLSEQNPLTTYPETRLIVGNDANLSDPNLQTHTASVLCTNAGGGRATQVVSPGDGGSGMLKIGHRTQGSSNVWNLGIEAFAEGGLTMGGEIFFADHRDLTPGPHVGSGGYRMSLTPSAAGTVASTLKLWNRSSDFYIGLKARDALGVSRDYTLPITIPAAGAPTKVLECNDASVTEWAEKGSAINSVIAAPVAYTLVMTDAYRYLRVNSTGAGSITIPIDAAVAFPIGTEISIINIGPGTITFTPVIAPTVNYYSPTGAATPNLPGGVGTGTFRACTLKKVDTDIWDIIGNLA